MQNPILLCPYECCEISYLQILKKFNEYQEEINRKILLNQEQEKIMIQMEEFKIHKMREQEKIVNEKRELEIQKKHIEETKEISKFFNIPAIPNKPNNNYNQAYPKHSGSMMPQDIKRSQVDATEHQNNRLPLQTPLASDTKSLNKNIASFNNKNSSIKRDQITKSTNFEEVKSKKLPFKIKAYLILRYCRNCNKSRDTDENPLICECGSMTCSVCKRDPHENSSYQDTE